MRHSRYISILAAFLLSLTVSGSALAYWHPAPERSATLPYQEVQRQISPQEARQIALSRVPGGEVVDIQRLRDSYRVRIIARNGRVVDIIVDAYTGRVR